jgi:hypothetical protein
MLSPLFISDRWHDAKLYDRTSDEITLDEIEKIAI